VTSIDVVYWDALREDLLGYNGDNAKNNQLINNRMIPINLELTIDGISGIRYGNAFTVDYIPRRYKKNSLFQVTYINDEITNSS